MKQTDNIILDGEKLYIVCDWCKKLSRVKTPHVVIEKRRKMVDRLILPHEFVEALYRLKRNIIPQEEIEKMNPQAQIACDQANITGREVNADIDLLIELYALKADPQDEIRK